MNVSATGDRTAVSRTRDSSCSMTFLLVDDTIGPEPLAFRRRRRCGTAENGLVLTETAPLPWGRTPLAVSRILGRLMGSAVERFPHLRHEPTPRGGRARDRGVGR